MTANGEVVVFKEGKIEVTQTQKETLQKAVFSQQPTEAEMELYFYDCARRGVHPLDKLIIFTKRSGKYTPITSIDYMRQRAESTGVYAGSDDAVFEYMGNNKEPFAAQVTVWKIVQGMRVSFSHTARMAEYRPGAEAFMWKKMPHNMLAKCAEAGALRKGFPTMLDKLYTFEEMDQAGPIDGVTTALPGQEVIEGKALPEPLSPSETTTGDSSETKDSTPTDTSSPSQKKTPEKSPAEPDTSEEAPDTTSKDKEASTTQTEPTTEPGPDGEAIEQAPWLSEDLSVEEARNVMYAWMVAEHGYEDVDAVRTAIVEAGKWDGNPPIPTVEVVTEIADYLQTASAA